MVVCNADVVGCECCCKDGGGRSPTASGELERMLRPRMILWFLASCQMVEGCRVWIVHLKSNWNEITVVRTIYAALFWVPEKSSHLFSRCLYCYMFSPVAKLHNSVITTSSSQSLIFPFQFKCWLRSYSKKSKDSAKSENRGVYDRIIIDILRAKVADNTHPPLIQSSSLEPWA